MWRVGSDPEGEGAGPCGRFDVPPACNGYLMGGPRSERRTTGTSLPGTSVATVGSTLSTLCHISASKAVPSSERGFSACVKFSTISILGRVTAGFCRRRSTSLASSSPTPLRATRSLLFPGPGGY